MASSDEPGWWPAGPIPRPERTGDLPRVQLEPKDEPAERRRSGSGRRIAGFIAVALAAGALGGALTGWAIGLDDEASAPQTTLEPTEVTTVVVETSDPPPAATDTDVSAVAARVLPSVVRVEVSRGVAVAAEDVPEECQDLTPDDEFPEACLEFSPVGTGSGVGFTEEGHILTNNHVVEDADRIEIELIDGRVYEAELVGRDELTDVAVLKVEPGLVQPIPLADRDVLAIGDTAIAVGNPLGLAGGPSVSVGILSAFERPLEITRFDGTTRQLQGLIQTDAAISGGSSGGALVDANGALIGITTAKSVGDSTEGVGFAVPVDLVTNIALDLISFGEIEHPFLGIWGTTAYAELDDGAMAPAGAEVTRIIDGSEPADPVDESAFGLAGAEAGDIIVGFDGTEIDNMNQLASLLRRYRAGQEVPVTVVRDGETVILDVVLGMRPEGT